MKEKFQFAIDSNNLYKNFHIQGGYDWYPCQHGRFETVEEGEWINNTTYCNGKDSQCTSEIIVTIPKLSLPSPGVVRHDYPQGQAPIIPQVSN